jgi:hypothetical protein
MAAARPGVCRSPFAARSARTSIETTRFQRPSGHVAYRNDPWAYRNDPWLDSHDDDGVFFPLCKGVASAYRKSIALLHRFDMIRYHLGVCDSIFRLLKFLC